MHLHAFNSMTSRTKLSFIIALLQKKTSGLCTTFLFVGKSLSWTGIIVLILLLYRAADPSFRKCKFYLCAGTACLGFSSQTDCASYLSTWYGLLPNQLVGAGLTVITVSILATLFSLSHFFFLSSFAPSVRGPICSSSLICGTAFNVGSMFCRRFS